MKRLLRRIAGKNKPSQDASGLRSESMEPRVLFSADLPWVSLDPSHSDPSAHSYEQAFVEGNAAVPQGADQLVAERQSFVAVDQSLITQQPAETHQALQALRQAGVEIALLDEALSGVEQLGSLLSERSGLSAIGLLTTANEQGLQLGSEVVSTDSVLNQANEISAWRGFVDKAAAFNIQAPGVDDYQQSAEVEALLASLTGAQVQVGGAIDVAALLPSEQEQQISREVVFVDSAVDDYEALVAGIVGSGDSTRSLEVVLLDPDQDGIAQISAVLAEREDISAVHIVSHGTEGSVQLGNRSLSSESLASHADELLGWRSALSDTADLLFYGCDLAGSADGQSLVASIAELTGADVAASTDLTGAQALGGDWDLEFTDGEIETQLAFGQAVQSNWDHVLGTTSETLVNQTTTNFQETNAYGGGSQAADANGNYIVVWQDNDSGTYDVYGRLYNADGTPASNEFLINSTTTNEQRSPSVAMNSSGDFVVAWTSAGQDQGVSLGTYAQRFSADGTPQGSEFKVNDNTNDDQWRSRVAIADDGQFAIVFTDEGSNSGDLYLQRYAADGTALGSNTIVNTTTSNMQSFADIAIDGATGNILVTWESTGPSGIYGRLLDSGGTAITSEFQVNSTTAGIEQNAKADFAEDGSFVIVWDSGVVGAEDMVARMFAADGTAVTGEISVNGYTSGSQNYGDVAVHDDGRFVVTWAGDESGGGQGIQAQLFASDGSKIGPQFLVNETVSGSRTNPSVDFVGDSTIFSWSGEGTGDSDGVYTRIIEQPGVASAPDTFVSATTEGGLSINQDGGNDIYLQADDGGALLGSLTSLTYETRYSTTDTSNQSLISYATASNDNEFKLTVLSSGNLLVQVGSHALTISDYDFRTLADDSPHTVSFSWDSAAGDWALYIDGAIEGSGTGLAVGQAIAGGGTLVIGNEQDAPGGDFAVNPSMSATLYDSRLFEDVRTAAEVSASYRSDLPFDEFGMVANWRFDTLSEERVVAESVSGNNLRVEHVPGTGFIASVASLSTALDENSVAGTVVGQVSGIDAERSAQIASLLAADPDLRYNAETDKFYKGFSTTGFWSVAKTAAESTSLSGVNGQLVTIRSAMENEFVREIAANDVGNDIWIGATDAGVEGQWRWVDGGSEADLFWSGDENGSNVSGAYHNFESGQPNDVGGNEDVVRLEDATGKWLDADHDNHDYYGYVVEWDADAVLDASQALVYSVAAQTVAGAFAVDPDSGEIRVLDSSLLDADTQALHTVTIRTTDVDSNTHDQAFDISLNNLVETNNAPTDLSSGIELNADGGNDAYLAATDGGAVLGGLTSLTFETLFQVSETRGDNVLIDYGTSATNDAFRVTVKDYGDLFVTVNGSFGSFTAHDYSDLLLDGQPHHFAVSWDSTNGDIAIHIDGELIESKTGYFAGETLAGGAGDGTLLFGQDIDSTGGGFGSDDGFNGSLYDVRVWNEVRSQAELSLNHQQKFDSGSLPGGLIANWQMDGLSGARTNQIADVVSGNNLIAAQVGDILNWTNQVGGVTADGNTLTYVDDAQTTGWNSQINSARMSTLGFTDDYSVRFTLDNTTNYAWTVGLGSTESDADFSDPEYAIFVDHIGDSNDVDIRHNGVKVATYDINFVEGGEFGFYVNGTTLEYQYDGVTFATDSIVASTDWYIDTSFYMRDSDSVYNNQTDYSLSNFHVVDGTGDSVAGFAGSTPVGDLHIRENANDNATVGFVVPTDPDTPRDVISDGQFTEGGDGGGAAWSRYTVGQTFGDWTVAAGDVDLGRTIREDTPLGGYSVDLSGDIGSTGAIAQSFDTIAGRQYQVVFALSGEWNSGPDVKELRASADGASVDFSITEPNGWSNANVLWENRSFTFTAVDESTVLEFASQVATGYGALIGDIQVVEIPAAVTTILNGDPTLSYDAATDKFYRFVETGAFFDTALADATSDSVNGVTGQLVTIRSAYENALIQQFAVESGQDIWLGTRDTNNDGNWNWLEGSNESSEQFWIGGSGGSAAQGFFAPTFGQSEAAGEDYARLKADGTWADDNEPSALAYVVEWDASEVLSNFTFSLTDDAGGRFAIDSDTGEITVADGSLLDYETAASHVIDVQVADAAGNSYVESMSIAIDNAAELAQSVPGAQIISEGAVLTFSSGAGNAVTVSDTQDYTDLLLEVSLNVADGYLTLSQLSGITIVDGSQGSSNLTFTGTESALNAALEGLTFTPYEAFSGAVTLNMSTSLSTELVAEYTFEGGGANDSSEGITQQGTLNGNAAVIFDGTRGNVLSLDGSGDYVEIDSEFDQPTDVTLAAWINFSSSAATAGEVISISNSVALRVGDLAYGVTGFFYNGSTFDFVSTGTDIHLNDDAWHHVAFSFDDVNNVQNLYIDGELVASANFTDSIVYPGWFPQTAIGTHADLNDSRFDFTGMIDGAQVYTRALSGAEIEALAADNQSVSDSVAITVTAVNQAPTYFTGSGVQTSFESSTSDSANDLLLQGDGSLIVVGTANDGSGPQVSLTRYLEDGSLDTSFGVGGRVVTALSTSDTVNAAALQPDGSIVVVGATNDGNGMSMIARYLSNGTLDTSFDGDGYVTLDIAASSSEYLRDVVVQADGRIVAVGYANVGDEVMSLVRLNVDGSLDSSLNGTGIMTFDLTAGDDRANTVAVQKDGKIVIGGQAGSYSAGDLAILRLNVDGSFDTSFNGSGSFIMDVSTVASGGSYTGVDAATALLIDDSGRIVIGGFTYLQNGESLAMRLSGDGTLDTSFNGVGYNVISAGVPHEGINNIALQPDGKLVLVGSAYTASDINDVSVIRVNTDGTLDASFDGDGMVRQPIGDATDEARAVVIDRLGNVVVVGRTDDGQVGSHIMRFDSSGELDNQFVRSNSLDGNSTFVEDSGPVVLDADVEIFDAELSELDNFDGATLTLVRNGGADPSDIYSATGSLLSLDQGSNNLNIGLLTIGSVTTNSGGTLALTFNSSATNYLVNQVMQQIAYSNSGDNPPASVQIDWTFDDGGDSVQSQGGAAEQATGSTMVNITAVNDAPVINNTNLVVNGDLETGDLTGWTTTGTVSSPGNALRFGEFNDAGPHTASQSFTTVVGQLYTLEFSHRDDSSSLNQQMQVTVEGATTNLSRTVTSSSAGTGYFNYTYTFVADSTTSTLTFTDVSPSSVSVDGFVDNVSVTQFAAFTPVTEDATNNAGNTVAEILASIPGDLVTDADAGAVEGIAVVDASWAFDYSLDGGATWQRMETVSTSSALLLRSTDMIRFVPNEIDSQIEDIEFRAWDQTSGTAGTYVSAASAGGSTAFSSSIAAAAIVTTNVNDSPTFGSEGGFAVGYGESGYNQNVASWALSDGSVLFTPYDENYNTSIGKLGPDGQLDVSFGNEGYFESSPIEYIRDIKEQSDGKFLVVGDTYPDFTLARYNADGTLDTSFGTNGSVTTNILGSDDAYEVAVHSDGSIIVVGEAGNDSFVAKFTSAGVLDTNFDGDSGTGDGIVTIDLGGAFERLASVTILPDGRILAAGESSVIRLTTTGVLDTTFDSDGILAVGHQANSLVVQANGDIAVAGFIGDNLVVSRFDADGGLDTGFGSGGTATWTNPFVLSSYGNKITQQADGKLIVVGTANTNSAFGQEMAVVRLNIDGSLDTTFGGNGSWLSGLTNDFADGYDISLFDDGGEEKIVVGGYDSKFGFSRATIARLSADGSLDTTYQSGQLDGNPTFVEGGAAVILDGNVQIFDRELSSDDDFSDAVLTLERNGGANAEDSFSATGDLVLNAGTLELDSVDIGTYTNAAGQLILTFANSVSNEQVNEVMQSIAYSNSSDTPPANVQIDWSFSDGNTGEQGSGGALVATGSTTVDITAVNDEPTTPDSSATGFEDTVLAITLTGADVDGTVVSFEISSLPANGTLYTDAALTDPIVAFNTYAATSEQLVLYFDPDANWNGSTTFTFSAVDNQANWDQSPATATLNINPVNDAALLDLDANDSSASGNDYAVSWTDGSGSVVVADSDASLTDVDSPNIESLTATITNLSDGALEVLSADVTGTSISASYDAATGTLTLSGTDTIANYEQVLRTISYDNTHSTPYSETRVLEFSANDGTADSLVATTSIAMNVTQGVLIVSNGGDVVDGDTSSIENLIANQGADGISLREAIIASNNSANGAGGPDIIRFDLSGTGPHTIALASQLPSITDHVIIDASTEPDFAGTPMVVLDGSAAPGGSKAFYLGAGSDGSTIRGLAIHSFATAIEIAGSDNNTVAGNYIGLEADGTTVAGNTDSGIRINGGSSNNTIGGLTQADRNVVAGSAGDGIQLSGAGTTGNQILGNYIGTDATGITAAANAVGIRVQSSATGNSIGGSVAGAGNVISGNSGSGVALGATADNQTIQGNYIGLDATGLAGLGNGQAGLNVLSDSNLIGGDSLTARNVISANSGAGVDIDGDSNRIEGNFIGLDSAGTAIFGNVGAGVHISNGATLNVIGGTAAGVGNVISGNVDGIYIQDATHTTIQANLIGTDVTGLLGLGNTDRGIQLESGADNTIIGGMTVAARNVISANGTDGIIISDGSNPGAGTTGVEIQGNYIGVGIDGATALGNGTNGIRITSVSGNLIGGSAAGAGNIIAHSGEDGIVLGAATATDNTILGNLIHSSTERAIDLGNDGTTLNDAAIALDGDSGANDLQNFAVLYTADIFGSDLRVVGDLDSKADTSYRVEFYSNPLGQEDASGYGEAREYLGFIEVTTDSLGNGSIDTLLSGVGLSAGDRVTATATEIIDAGQIGANDRAAFGSTSEFSQNLPAATGDPAPVIDLDANRSSGAGAPNFSTSFTEDAGAVSVVDADATLFDPDSSALSSLTITITNQLDGTAETLAANTVGTSIVATYDSGTGVLALSGSDTVASYQQVLRSVTYNNSAQDPDTTQRSLTFVASDGANDSNTATTSIAMTAANDPVSGQPVILGTPTEDETLTIDASGISDAEGLGAFSYQWYRDGVAISGATADSYVLNDADVDTNVTVTLSYTDGQGTSESTTSSAVGPIANVNDAPTGSVVIDNLSPGQGDVLTASNTIADADGLSGAISYQWYRDGVAIGSATGNTYATTQTDVNTVITVVASYTDDEGTAESVTSGATAAVSNVNDAVSGQPVILGTPTEDQTLTIDASGISDADGLGSYSYQWYRDGVAISGATTDSHVLSDADVDTNVTVTLSYTDGQGTSESTTSAAVGPIANVNDAPTGAVSIDNLNPSEGDTLTVSNTIADADGISDAISYQWYRDGVAIGSATGATYATVQADVGAAITVVASYTDDQGSAESLTSAATAAVINVNDTVVGQPVILGVATEDETLTIDASGISDEDGLGSFSYQWYRDGVAVSGATADSYLLDDADVGTAITVALAYTDGEGTAESTTSGAVGAVANVNDAPTGSVLIDDSSPSQGDTLTASNSIADADGISGAIGYQWYRDGVAIGSAIGSTYATTQADVGAVITVVASYTDDQGTAESVTSSATAAVTNVNDAVSGQPLIVGTPTEDQTLTIDASGISDADGLGSFSYQWYRDGVAIAGATADSYTLDDADVDAAVSVALAYTDGQGSAETTTSNAVGPIANVNDAPTGAVSIDNLNPGEGDTLSASNTIADADGISGAIGYQWYRDGVAIGSATGTTYETVQADVGAAITVVASYTDDQGSAESLTSAATAAVINVNDSVAGQPVIVGVATEDETLTIDASGISDEDGLGSFSYQWYRDGVAVSGATADSYLLDDADVGAAITVALAYTDGGGTAETTTSNAVGPIANVNDTPTGSVLIDNLGPAQGDTLTASNTIADADGISGVIGYQWYRDGVAIGSATGSTYETTQVDVDTVITVVASYTDDEGTAESVTSSATAAVTNVNDAVSGQPVILGTPTEDQTLTIDASGISDADGLGSYSYQWYRDGVVVSGATADSYTLDDTDVGTAISVVLSYVDGEGTAETTTSNAVGPIANVNDAPTGAVSIDNLNPGEGDTLTVANTLADADGMSGAVSYQWYRDGLAIGSATGATYTTEQADVGSAMTVVASYTDDRGASESVTSAATAAVVNVNDAVVGQPLILGAATEDQTLTIDESGISDEDGLGPFSYQWYRDGVAIAGATADSLTLGDADVDANITVTLRYTDSEGTSETTTSNAVGPVANVNDNPTGTVTIDNVNPSEGDTVTATNTLADADGLSGPINYQWYRDGVAIGSATNASYTTQQADVGAALTVLASYIDDQGATESVVSSATAAVLNVNDPVSGSPVLLGMTTEDQTLTADTAGISDEDGLGAFSYQWYRDGVAVAGATSGTFALDNADVGTSIAVTVAYTDAYGAFETTSSAPSALIQNVNDAPTGSVVIDNLIPAQGDVLTATDTITDADGLSSAIGYQWLRDGVAIAGATGTTYATGQDDVGAAITVVASYTDDQGATESVLSSATGNVTNVNDLVAGQPLIVGAATENQTLGIDTSGISDPDGLGSFDYQWYRDGVAITGADADSYTLEDSDVGASISVTVSYIDGYGTAENVASDLAGPVVNVNDLPLVDGGQFFNVAESSAPGSSVGPIMGSDIDPGAMLSEWAIESGNDSDLFTIDADSGELKLSDNATLDFESAATHVLSISVSDGSARSAPVAVTVNIVDVNEAPITLADAFGGREDVAVTINVAADLLANDGDPENAVLSVASIGQPGNGVLMDNLDGTWTYLPNENFFGTDSFSYVVTDGINSTNSTATVTVDAVNDAPVLAVPSWWQMQEDLSGVATIRGSDVDGDPLSYQLGGADADAFQLDASTGVLSFVDAPDYEAPTDANADNLYEVEVAVQDSSGARTTQALQIEVENVNEAPQLAPAQFAFTPTSETLMVGAVDAADPDDGDVLNYRIVAGNDGAMFAIDQSSGQLQASDLGVPLGIYELEVEVADSEGLVSKALVQIIVTESTVTQVPLADDGLTPAEVDSGESSGRSADSAGVPQQDESGSSEPEVAAAEQEQRAEEGRAVAAFSSGPIAPVAALLTEVFAPQALALDLNALGIASNDDSAPLSGAAAGQVDLGLYIRVVFGDAVGGFDNGLDLSTEEYDGVLGLPISPELVNALDEAARAALTDGEELDLRVSGAVLGSVSLSAGFVVWILRAGSLMASLASAKPMWSHFDPLPVFANDDDSEDEHSIKL